MCGIAGIITQSGFDKSLLNKMSKIIRHRGPDDEGFVTVNGDDVVAYYKGDDTITEFQELQNVAENSSHQIFQVGLVHRRLSIIDLSATGHQPMQLENDQYIIVYNGEVYNYREIRDELKLKNHHFTSDSDTEVILKSYIEWGENCMQKFIGMWALAIYDKNKQAVFISRDRFGIKPLYYVFKNNQFIFASEIKAILASNFVQPILDQKNLYQYFSFGKLSDPFQTLYKDIIELPPAHHLNYFYKENRLSVKEYYSLEQTTRQLKNNNYTNGDSYDTYKNLLESAVNIHMRADVPVGSCLSGGLDSSAIVALASKQTHSNSFNTFTAAYHETEIDESAFAKAVIASNNNIKGYFTYPTAAGYQTDIDRLIWHQDLPIASSSMFAQWEVMKLAKMHNMKVLLDGQGADETLGGYSIFSGMFLFDLLKKAKFAKLIKESKSLKHNRSIRVLNEIGRAASHSFPEKLKTSLRSRQRVGSGMLTENFNQTWKNEKSAAMYANDFYTMSLQNIKFGLHDLLRYEDRNSMAFSIESRVPFLDHRLVEYTLALPTDFKMKDGWSKYILRKAVEKELPQEVVWRKDKKGFVTPQKKWKKELNSYLNDYINSANFPQVMDKKYILQLNKSDLTNSSQLSEFWKMFSFLKWNELFKINT